MYGRHEESEANIPVRDLFHERGASMSIVRVGLAETKRFAEGYEAIFGQKNTSKAKKKTTSARKRAADKKRRRPR